MSILPQHKCLTRSPTHVPNYHHLCLRRLVICSATTTKSKTKPAQLVTEPRLVNPPTSVTPIAPPVLNDRSLQSTWSHRIWVATGCTTVLISLAKAIVAAADSHIWLQPILAGYIGYILADLGSGVYHWGIDNFGDASTPIFGAQIEAFQGHHKWPWTITRRQFANNLHALARAVTFCVLPIDLAFNDPTIHAFVSVCSGCIMFSQQFHAWAHGTKSKLPPLVVAMQDVGLLVSRAQHAAHHRPPYNNNYCIVSGVWNEFLDQQKVFEALEMILYFQLGVRPRSWSEPTSDWTEEVEAPSQVTVQ
ncbi:hypothetical protein P3X46_027172 [Hevea brasiliensis]|uniref:Lipid desaturase domain-containing protein n=1 Tax=Hevea brasiliensis TaxID=3981 RepID=A0ABQ9L0H8_HEVBR|nr:fatty acid desaturase 4, chloroplastic [Hevea brasiliensis]KAJ9153764.1 hypothetical protein P3X46_027172 [Hevea brasiliensis]